MKRSSAVSTGNGDESAQRRHEELGLGGLLAVLTPQRQREPDDDVLDLVLGDEARELGQALARSPPSRRRRRDGRACRSRRRSRRPCGPSRSRARGPARSSRARRESGARPRRARPASFSGSLPPARAIVRRPPPPPPTSAEAALTTSEALMRSATASSKLAIRVTLPSSTPPSTTAAGTVALLEAIGEVEQRVAVEPVHGLHDQVDAVLGAHVSPRRLPRSHPASACASAPCAPPRARSGARRPRARDRGAAPTPHRR